MLFEEGAAKGEPVGRTAAALRALVHGVAVAVAGTGVRYFLTPGGRLATRSRSARGRRARSRPTRRHCPKTDYRGRSGGIWAPHPTYHWKQIPKGTGLGWITAPMKRTGRGRRDGSLDVWVKTRAKDVDLEATVSDVRRNGREVYVQSGWLRASHRTLAKSLDDPAAGAHRPAA